MIYQLFLFGLVVDRDLDIVHPWTVIYFLSSGLIVCPRLAVFGPSLLFSYSTVSRDLFVPLQLKIESHRNVSQQRLFVAVMCAAQLLRTFTAAWRPANVAQVWMVVTILSFRKQWMWTWWLLQGNTIRCGGSCYYNCRRERNWWQREPKTGTRSAEPPPSKAMSSTRRRHAIFKDSK